MQTTRDKAPTLTLRTLRTGRTIVARPDGTEATGVVAWRGFSLLTGDPIALVVLFPAKSAADANAKTGAMAQTYIIPDPDRIPGTPMQWVANGTDAAVCGDCPRRPIEGGDAAGRCYVTIAHGVRSTVAAMRRGNYPETTPEGLASSGMLAGVELRAGSWGDPAAVPVHVWLPLIHAAAAWTGYTHQWRDPMAAEHRTFCMASADSLQDKAEATAAGWRTFRVADPDGPETEPTPDEIRCPASDEAGKLTTCKRCRLCGGTSTPARSIVILDHGPDAR